MYVIFDVHYSLGRKHHMNSTVYAQILSNRAVQVIATVIATILLGALGSGLWELFLRDIILGLGNFTLSLISSVWGGYVDLLHRDVGKLRSDLLVTPLFAFFLVILIFGPWFYVKKLLSRVSYLRKELTITGDEASQSLEQITCMVDTIRRKIFRILIPIIFCSSVMYAILGWQLTYTRNAGTWAERSIEILLPYVTPQEHNKLRSDLRMVETAEQFYALEKQLQAQARKASIRLPSFTIIKKPNAT